MSKVVHLDEGTHRRLRAWCDERKVEMKDVVEALIERALSPTDPRISRWPDLDKVERRARRR